MVFVIRHVRGTRPASVSRRASVSVSSARRVLAERVEPRVVGAGRHPLGVDLVDLVLGTVDVEVETRVEEVLMMRRGHAFGDHVRERGLRARLDRHRRHDAGQLHLELDVAVEIEVPVEAVLVVADRRDEADHEPAAAAHLGSPAEHVDVLPEDPVVLFVHADRVVDHPRLALLVRDRRVEVVDLAEAVAAERERLRHAPEAPLPRVEGVLPAVQLARVAVGHDHLRDRRAVQDRADAAVVVVGDLVQHEAFVRDRSRCGTPSSAIRPCCRRR